MSATDAGFDPDEQRPTGQSRTCPCSFYELIIPYSLLNGISSVIAGLGLPKILDSKGLHIFVRLGGVAPEYLKMAIEWRWVSFRERAWARIDGHGESGVDVPYRS